MRKSRDVRNRNRRYCAFQLRRCEQANRADPGYGMPERRHLITLIAWRQDMVLFKPLDLKLVRFYGRISYSFYLLHPLGMLLASRTVDPQAFQAWGVPSSLTIFFAALTAILFTTPAAYLLAVY
jgi:hypothetical protein